MAAYPHFDVRSVRKIRLYCAACCRSVWNLLLDKRYRAALQAIENNPAFVFSTKRKAYLRVWLLELQCFSLPYNTSQLPRSKSERLQALPIFYAAMAAWKSIAVAKALVELRMLTEEQLVRFLRKKAEKEIFDLFDSEDGEFVFTEFDLPQLELLPMRIDVSGMLLRVTQNLDEKEEYDFDSTGIRLDIPRDI